MSKNLSSSLADQIRSAREARSLSQEQLAAQADVCLPTVRSLERGHPGSVRVLRKLIRVLGIEELRVRCQ